MRAFLASVAVVLAGAVMGFSGGCAEHSKPILPPAQMTQDEKNFDALWQSSIDTLRKYYFTLDVQDRRRGLIVTAPTVSRNWFEFWRSDAVTTYDVTENSLQTIYRKITVTIRPSSSGSSTYVVAVTVDVYRSDRLDKEAASVSSSYDMFILPGATMKDNTILGETNVSDEAGQTKKKYNGVVSLGQDKRLAGKLAEEISLGAGVQIPVPATRPQGM